MSGIFSWTSTVLEFNKLFEKATSHLLLEPDWESILQITDCIRQGDVQPSYVIVCIKKKLHAPNPHVVLYTLQVLESCVKNCGAQMHAEVATRTFMEELKDLVKKTTNDNVRSRILELIQAWSHAFRNEPKYRAVQDIFNMLKMEGYKLQPLKESDAMFMADSAPDWADGDCCHRCRSQFTVVLRKHHCRNCGQIFCSKCSSRSCAIPRFGIEKEVRVCEGCWEKIMKPGAAAATVTTPKSVSSAPEGQPRSAQPSSDPASAPKGKTDEELKEEEELQLALALSQSEAEEKQKQQSKSSIYSTLDVLSSEKKSTPSENELDKYLNRSYWEQKQQQQKEDSFVSPTETRNSPTPSAPLSINSYNTRINERYQNGEVDELADFLGNLTQTVEIFNNRMKSNSSRGRPIASDTHVQSLFMNITNMHSQLLKHIQEQEDMRAYYERLQDKLNQARDARAALDALRDEHQEKLRREAEEAERIRQIQMQQKLEIMRKKKQEYLQYQRQLAMMRIHEQEREMQMRQEQQKHQYHVPVSVPPGQMPQPNFGPPQPSYAQNYGVMPAGPNDPAMQQQPYHSQYKPTQMPEYHPAYNMQALPGTMQQMPPQAAPYHPPQPGIPTSHPMAPPTTSHPMAPPPQMMMHPMAPPAPHMGMMAPPQQQQQPIMVQQQNPQPSPQHQTMSPPPQEQHQDPLIVFD